MNRADRIRRVVPGAPGGLVATLAAMPLAEVDAIVALARQARRDALSDERARRRARRRSRTDDDKYAEAVNNLITAWVKRASVTLETLALLKRHYDHGPEVLTLAVAGARAQGYSDTEIGVALGYDKEFARQAVGTRWGRRGHSDDCSDGTYSDLAVPAPDCVTPVNGSATGSGLLSHAETGTGREPTILERSRSPARSQITDLGAVPP